MTRFGVDISLAKTHVSKDTYEFAKRWIRGGKEVTGLPVRGISDHHSDPKRIYMILMDYVMKGGTYLFKGTLQDLVLRALRGLIIVIKKGARDKRITLSIESLALNLALFPEAMRQSLGISTGEEQRNVLHRC